MSTLCEQAGILIIVEAKQLNTLADFAVRVRYPGEGPTLDEAREALEIAKSVRRFARGILGV